MTPVTPSSVCDMQGESFAALKAAVDALDRMGDMPDYDVSPYVWRALDCQNIVVKARAALAERTQQEAPAPYDFLDAPQWYCRLNEVWLQMHRTRIVGVGFQVDDAKACDWMNTLNLALALSKDVLARPTSAANSTAPMQLPESMSRDEMLKYYSEYANMQSNEALRYQKRIRDLEKALAAPTQAAPAAQPIDMVLHCPKCGLQHIDAPDERTPDWKNEPHRSHLCHGCGHIWRPADVPTNGVRAVKTRGKADSAAPAAAVEPTPFKGHEIAAVVNKLRDVAKEFGNTQQLRERISRVVHEFLAHQPTCTYCGDRGWVEEGDPETGGNMVPCDRCKRAAAVPEGLTGVFKGADGLQKLAECDVFWENQTYGTRLYFGDGVADYLHRDVLRAAVKTLAASDDAKAAIAGLTWIDCKTRAPWVKNSLKASAEALRSSERRARYAYEKPFMGEPTAFMGDAYAEAAAVFERRLTAIDAAIAASTKDSK